MAMMHKNNWPTRFGVYSLCVAFVCLVYPGAKSPAVASGQGAQTSDEAARLGIATDENDTFTLTGWQPTREFFATSALADTTELDFPEDEEGRKHLVRDVGVFLMVSVFVGYFIAKVFLEGDTDEPPPPDNGKDIPGSNLLN